MSKVTSYMLIRPHLSDEAILKIDAECGGTWWRSRVDNISGDPAFYVEGEIGKVAFDVVLDPYKYRTPTGEDVVLKFNHLGDLREDNPTWDAIRGR